MTVGSRGQVLQASSGSEMYHWQARDTPEVAQITGRHLKAEHERGSADQQVAEGDHHAPALLFTVNLAS